HHGHRVNGGNRIGDVLSGDVWGTAVHRLKDAYRPTDTGRRQHANRASQHRGLITQNVTKQIARDDHVKLPWGSHQLHRTVVNITVFELDITTLHAPLRPLH